MKENEEQGAEIEFTAKASERFRAFAKNGMVALIAAKKSGCAGYEYSVSMIEKRDGVKIFNGDGFEYSVDEDSESLCIGLLIDVEKNGLAEKIVFKNVRASHVCGCGISFSF